MESINFGPQHLERLCGLVRRVIDQTREPCGYDYGTDGAIDRIEAAVAFFNDEERRRRQSYHAMQLAVREPRLHREMAAKIQTPIADTDG